MNILIAAMNFLPEVIGSGKYTGEMALWLARRDHAVRVVAAPPYYPDWQVRQAYRGKGFFDERLEVAEAGGEASPVSVLRCPVWVPRRPSGLKRILHLASFALFSLLPIARSVRWRPDVVVCVQPTRFVLPAALALAKLAGARLWLHVQDLEIDAAFELGILRRRWLRDVVLRVEKWLLLRCDRVSTISRPMLQKLVEKGVPEERVRLVENWVNLDVIAPLNNPSPYRSELGLPAGTCVALYSGNMAEKQGLEIVIEAARRLGVRKDICFVLCGEGPARSKLEHLSAGLPNVRLLPLQPVERLNELLNLADVHVLPQKAEVADLVMPSKLTNMLASGRPVVATAAPGTQVDMVLRHCGVVVLPGDVTAFAGAVAALADDPVRRREMGRVGREYAELNWARDEILSRFEAELLGITGSRTAR